MTMISEQWAYAQIPVIYKFFDVGYSMRPSLIPQLFNIQSSTRSKEEHVGIGGINDAAWEGYEKSGRVGEVDFSQGYLSTFTPKEYPVDVVVKRKLLDDDQYGIIGDTARRLGISSMQLRERHAASVFNNAFSSSFVGGDGVSLCNDSHPDNPNSSGTQDNAYALELSATNIETMRIAMMQYKDDAGNVLGVMPDTILVPLALENTARIATQSMNKPGSMDNDVNPQNGRWNIVVWPYLTDTNAWFMMDSVWMRESLIWYNRITPEFTFKELSQVEVKWQAYMRYSYGWKDWRWIAGSNPS